MITEEQITKLAKILNISREEAIATLKSDEAVDKMKMSEVNDDLNAEQIKAQKEARKADGKKQTVFKFDTTKRKRVENPGKRGLIETIRNALEDFGCTNIDVTNVEREIVFFSDGVKYKIQLSAPRS